ncbi:MAG: HlyD family type I secretion periplasmic adaptor subunit, partial [Acetobacteraceae bacterium]
MTTITQDDRLAMAQALRGPRRAGQTVMVVFIGGFFAWGLTAPIAGGAVAPGIISPDGSRRTVQHLEGGIIAAIRVRDGDRVSAGDPLVLIESLQARTVYNSLLDQHRTLVAMRARLESEQADSSTLIFPEGLAQTEAGMDLALILNGQKALFATRRAAHESRKEVLRLRIEQSEEQIRGTEAQVASATQQLQLIAEELVGKEALLRQGLVPRPEVLQLKRQQAELLGRRGEYLGAIARNRQVIGEAEMQILGIDAERLDKIAEQLDKVRAELAGVTERLQSSRDILARTVVGAPISGTVVNLRFRTIEGVIRAGEAIVDIVPDEERLLIDARVTPIDIDVVQSGMPVEVRLTAYSSRGLPRIRGTVHTVSADRLMDDANNQPYYLARVEVDRSELAKLGPNVALVPGMPAEVLIVRRERTCG